MTKSYDERLADNLRHLTQRMHGDLIDLAKWLASILLASNGAALVITFEVAIGREVSNPSILLPAAWAFAVGAALVIAAATWAYLLGQLSIAVLNDRADYAAIATDATATAEQKKRAAVADSDAIAQLRRIQPRASIVALLLMLSAVSFVAGILVPLSQAASLVARSPALPT